MILDGKQMKKLERNEVEHLRGIIRKLKSENRNLKKQVSRSEKNAARMEATLEEQEEVQEEQEYEEKQPQATRCPECKSLCESTSLGNRTIHRCSSCKWRRTTKG